MSNNENNDNPGCRAKKTSIGGQALIEGIMMRGPKKTSMAVRNPQGEMVVETWDTDNAKKHNYYRWPFFRGVFGFIDSMKFGYKCLMRSAEIAGFDDEDDKSKGKRYTEKIADGKNDSDVTGAKEAGLCPATHDTADINNKTEGAEAQRFASEPDIEYKKENSKETAGKKNSDSKMMTGIMITASVLGVVLALVLFKALPEGLYQLLVGLFPSMSGTGYGYQLLRSLITGVFKIFIVVGYMALVSLMKDIKRTFMYHGAEHKSITCYEKGLELTVDNVKKQTRFHPRCGTSFLILVVIVGVIITMFIPANLSDNGALNVVLRSLISIALLPFMMSLGYELIRFAGKHDNALTRFISAPGVWLQNITTREPEDSMIECAITALENVIPNDSSDDWISR